MRWCLHFSVVKIYLQNTARRVWKIGRYLTCEEKARDLVERKSTCLADWGPGFALSTSKKWTENDQALWLGGKGCHSILGVLLTVVNNNLEDREIRLVGTLKSFYWKARINQFLLDIWKCMNQMKEIKSCLIFVSNAKIDMGVHVYLEWEKKSQHMPGAQDPFLCDLLRQFTRNTCTEMDPEHNLPSHWRRELSPATSNHKGPCNWGVLKLKFY